MINYIIGKLNLYIIGLLLVSLFVSVKKCHDNKQETKSAINALNNDIKLFENELGTLTASKEVLKVSNRNLNKIILKKNDTLKKLAKQFSKVKSIIEIKTVIQIDSVDVPFIVKLPSLFERHGVNSDHYFRFKWKANQDGFTLSDINIPNEQYVITGFKRKLFLGRTTLITDITNTNPYIDVKRLETTVVHVPVRLIDTRVFNIGVGFLAAAILLK